MRCEVVGPNARGRRRERGKGFLSRRQLREGLGLPTLAAASFVTSRLQRESAMASREFARVDRIMLRRAPIVSPGRSNAFTHVVGGQGLAQTKLGACSSPALLGEQRGCLGSGATG